MTCTFCDDPEYRCPLCGECLPCRHERTVDYWWRHARMLTKFRIRPDGSVYYKETR